MDEAETFGLICSAAIGWMAAIAGWYAFACRSREIADARAGWYHFEKKYHELKESHERKEESHVIIADESIKLDSSLFGDTVVGIVLTPDSTQPCREDDTIELLFRNADGFEVYLRRPCTAAWRPQENDRETPQGGAGAA